MIKNKESLYIETYILRGQLTNKKLNMLHHTRAKTYESLHYRHGESE